LGYEVEQSGLDVGVHAWRDRAGSVPGAFSPHQVQLDRLFGDRLAQPGDLGQRILIHLTAYLIRHFTPSSITYDTV
jgi:hypothetical protein